MPEPEPHKPFEGMSARQIRKLGPHGMWRIAEKHLDKVGEVGSKVDLGGNVTVRRDQDVMFPKQSKLFMSHRYKAWGRRVINTDEWQCSTRGGVLTAAERMFMAYSKGREPELRKQGLIK